MSKLTIKARIILAILIPVLDLLVSVFIGLKLMKLMSDNSEVM